MMVNGKPVWEYKDATGVKHRGVMMGFSDFGGTDVTYRFHRLDENNTPIVFENGGISLDLVSGARLKEARRLWTEEKASTPS